VEASVEATTEAIMETLVEAPMEAFMPETVVVMETVETIREEDRASSEERWA
jgi:hypothetical protein